MVIKPIHFSLALILMSLMAFAPAKAARVANFKGRKVLVDLEQSASNVGERYYAINQQGRKTGLVEIKVIKGTRALGLLLKGQVERGSFLEPTATGTEPISSPIMGGNDQPMMTSSSKMAVGGLLGLSFNSISAKNIVTDDGTISPELSGMSFNVGGLFDYNLSRQFSLRILGGYETLEAESEGGTVYGVSISYLGAGGLLRYHLMDGKFKVWAGLGVHMLMAIGKESNLINTDEVGFSQAFPLALGADFALNSKSFIPVQFEYNIWPSNSSISTSTMIIRGGYAYRF